jgi:putative ABC transport system ATP-binding protein
MSDSTDSPTTSSGTKFRFLQQQHPALLVRNLNHWFGEGENRKQCLFHNNLTINPGELVVITGPSGSGKTTVLTLVGGLRTVQDGSVRVLDRELHGLTPLELTAVRRDIGFIFQAHNLFDSLSAIENVSMALELKQNNRREMNRMATEILTRLGLGHRIHYKPSALSGGQRQRVAIARALVNKPRLVLADEPTAALDKASGHEVLEVFKELAQVVGTTVLLVTHDSRILDVADRIVHMVDGAISSEILVEEALTICNFLVNCSVFAHTSPGTLTTISQKMHKERFPAGSTIIRQGEEGDKFYVVVDGRVKVTVTDQGATRAELFLAAGDFFGEAALLTGQPRAATCTAEDDVTLYSLGKANFLEAMEKSGTLKTQLKKAFSIHR